MRYFSKLKSNFSFLGNSSDEKSITLVVTICKIVRISQSIIHVETFEDEEYMQPFFDKCLHRVMFPCANRWIVQFYDIYIFSYVKATSFVEHLTNNKPEKSAKTEKFDMVRL